MAKRRKHASYDIRPRGAKVRKPWTQLTSSTKSYWRKKVDVRPAKVRRRDPIDRIRGREKQRTYLLDWVRRPAEKRQTTGGDYQVDVDAFQARREADKLRGKTPDWGYSLHDFRNMDHPEGYSYVLYHLYYSFNYKGGSSQVTTKRGVQVNTPEEAIVEGDAVEEAEGYVQEGTEIYLDTIIAVVPVQTTETTDFMLQSRYPGDQAPRPPKEPYKRAKQAKRADRSNEYLKRTEKRRAGRKAETDKMIQEERRKLGR